MRLFTRKLLDKSFSACAIMAVVFLTGFLFSVLTPIFIKGIGAYVFRGTVEYRQMIFDQFGRGDKKILKQEVSEVAKAREPVYSAISAFEKELKTMSSERRRELKPVFRELREEISALFGPEPGKAQPVLPRMLYGETRWDRAQYRLRKVLFEETWDYSSEDDGVLVYMPREPMFKGTSLEPVFDIFENKLPMLMKPRMTFYGRFLTDKSIDAHFFGGIGPEVMGTVYLALTAMIIAIPLGVIAAIYFQEYAEDGFAMTFLRSCVNTLAGVPSIVFGLFGLAFFINTIKVSPGKSVLAGSLTLALLVLPTVIRSSEEAIASVPRAYKEGALALGAGRWRTVLTVILPAALPGILTGTVISMGRAAGETAPIIFTAAVSVGRLSGPFEMLLQDTPALSWNLYNICTEHEAVDQIRHVQYGMAFTLVALVLSLNLAAILIRARVSRRLKG
ncbi:MAG: phosphate ABC transporter permease PstA [Kiritimatiellia bacterium]